MHRSILLAILIAVIVPFQTKVVVDRNLTENASSTFQFKNVPSPVKDDLASSARLFLIDGQLDQGSGDLAALTDGRLPTDEDEPGSNCFFSAGSSGGRFSMDFARVVEIGQINSYSWHPNSRGPQLYRVYGADGSDPRFDAKPKRGIDPSSVGWKYIATVGTIPESGEDGGQYGVSIGDGRSAIGKFRYLLFDCYATELNDDWGNTFYSEIDVLPPKSP